MSHLRLFSSLVLLCCLCACQKKQEPQIATVTEAYRLIDAQRDDEAIALLERELAQNPNNHEAKVTLASAYGHKAGFRIQAFWNMLDSARRQEIAKLQFESDSTSAAAKFVNYIRSTIAFARAIENLPNLNSQQYGFLEYGLGILDGIAVKEKRPSDHLLSALYRSMAFKARVGWMYSLGSFAAKDSKGNCTLVVDRLSDSVVDSARILEKISFDLSYAFPKEQIELQNSRKRLASLIQNLTLQLDTLGVLDEAFKITFKSELAQKGFGGMVQCSGDATVNDL